MTWKELKEFANSLPEKELDKKVILWREDEAITNIEANQLEEDHYIDLKYSEYGCFEESEMKYQLENDEDKSEKDYKKVYDKGTPILNEIF